MGAAHGPTYKRLNVPMLEMSASPLSFDLISARSETYSHPGALPTVKKSTLDGDLRRRDFTINAMAIRLDAEFYGELFDPLGGQNDLQNKLIRILHPGSFVDDPTRMFRAIRYAMRYGFDLEPATRQALYDKEARIVLSQLSGERIRHEFDLIFEQQRAVSMLDEIAKLDLLQSIHPSLLHANSQPLTTLTNEPDKEFCKFSIPEILSCPRCRKHTLHRETK